MQTMRPILPLLLLMILPTTASAQGDVFLRVFQSTGLEGGNLRTSYSLEGARGLREYLRPDGEPGSGTGGGGGGGRRSYEGVNHRIQAAVGLVDWLSLGMEQTIRQPGTEPVSLGVVAPELRLRLNPLIEALEDSPLEISTFIASRIRVSARRPSSAVLGVGLHGDVRRFHLAADVAFETTMDSDVRENGMRYRLGASADIVRNFNIALEIWGAMVWPEDGIFQQDHHGGPSLRYQLGPVWMGAHANFGVKERPAKIFLDVGFMGQVGLQW